MPKVIYNLVYFLCTITWNAYDNLLGMQFTGIKPYVTIYNWDMPQVLEDSMGGWLNPEMVYGTIQLWALILFLLIMLLCLSIISIILIISSI